jgi:hypothetical protein
MLVWLGKQWTGLLGREIEPIWEKVSLCHLPDNLLLYLGWPDEVASIQRFNRKTGAFETTVYYNDQPSGTEFKITNGEAYLINMRIAKQIIAPISAPVVAITSHRDGEAVTSYPITVSGTISDSSPIVTVNGY